MGPRSGGRHRALRALPPAASPAADNRGDDLAGMTVLDIGAWDGYFSFEFERRGAKRVLAIDTYAWDRGGLECFLLAHEHFKSRVEHRRMDVHELSPTRWGPSTSCSAPASSITRAIRSWRWSGSGA